MQIGGFLARERVVKRYYLAGNNNEVNLKAIKNVSTCPYRRKNISSLSKPNCPQKNVNTLKLITLLRLSCSVFLGEILSMFSAPFPIFYG